MVHREPWWRKKAAWKQLISTLEEILGEAKARRWESGTRGEGGGVRQVEKSDAGSDGTWYAGTETGDVQVGE